MTKKKRQRKERAQQEKRARERERREERTADGREPEEVSGFPGLPPDPRAMERMTARMGRIMGEQQFGSMEEAQTFMNRYLSEGGGTLEEAPAPSTPLERAQELIYDAFDTDDPQRRVDLAEEALEVTEDCADAYVLLAEETAEDAEEARELYEAGVRAGERALGEEIFTEEAGNFWGILETRPYMRAQEGLASSLWVLGERGQALTRYRRILELNPGDNQGVRYELAGCLMDEGLDEELGELLEQYEEEASAYWLYTRALWRFRTEGASERATRELEEATGTNPYVPLYLLGRKNFLAQGLPELIGLGDESEAVSYFARALTEWLRTPGAVEWVRENTDEQILSQLEQE
jgi:tetratricopeptide (TPR) repeat protein